MRKLAVLSAFAGAALTALAGQASAQYLVTYPLVYAGPFGGWFIPLPREAMGPHADWRNVYTGVYGGNQLARVPERRPR